MKARKQKLEEQITNLFLAKQIPDVVRDSILESLALTENLEEVEGVLNNLTTLKQMTEYGNAFKKKLKEVRDRGEVLQVDNEKHIRQLFNSLAGKGLLKGDSNGYMVNNDDWSSDLSCLTDQEFLLFIEINSCAVEQYKKREE
jgi:hypothetical protein